jgi:hypothetical protein
VVPVKLEVNLELSSNYASLSHPNIQLKYTTTVENDNDSGSEYS